MCGDVTFFPFSLSLSLPVRPGGALLDLGPSAAFDPAAGCLRRPAPSCWRS